LPLTPAFAGFTGKPMAQTVRTLGPYV